MGMSRHIVRATVIVDFAFPEDVVPVTDSDGGYFGYKMPDGRVVEPAACIRIESPDEDSETFAVTDSEMSSLGITLQSYVEITMEGLGDVS